MGRKRSFSCPPPTSDAGNRGVPPCGREQVRQEEEKAVKNVLRMLFRCMITVVCSVYDRRERACCQQKAAGAPLAMFASPYVGGLKQASIPPTSLESRVSYTLLDFVAILILPCAKQSENLVF